VTPPREPNDAGRAAQPVESSLFTPAVPPASASRPDAGGPVRAPAPARGARPAPDRGAGIPAESGQLSPSLIELAHAYGVATEFWDWRGQHTTVPRHTIVAVLAALDVQAGDEAAVGRSLAEARDRPWRRVLPDICVVREGTALRVPAHVPHGTPVEVWVELEGGGRRPLQQEDHWVEPHSIDSRMVGEATFVVPDDLPLGWHTLHALHTRGEAERPLVVTPSRLDLPPGLAERRGWGFMTQLYSVRSERSWGLGDLADLRDLVAWSARSHGADFVLVNPLHAAEPVPPMQPSPYLPASRRFGNPVYLRVEDIHEVAYMASADRALIEWSAEAMRGMNSDPGELDRDAVWEAKKAALETVFLQPRTPRRQALLEAFCEREGTGLLDFATWCALAERYGLPMSRWPRHVLDPRSDVVAQLREELAERVSFYMWLQWCLDSQLAAAQREAGEAGMRLGVVHDLAVGVHPEGADVWALGDALAQSVTVGAPPDAFNQQGQDWSQPPWRPDRLAELGYAPYRDMLRTILRHAGGLRVDHIIGLFRLWWVPKGCGPAEGTYVRYDHEALIGILALEARRAGAVVVGEDLGTVEPWVRDYLRERGVLGTSILWFERDGARRPLRPEAYRDLCLASVTTHDLPSTAGYLAGSHITLRERLGLLTRSAEEERAVDEADRAAVLAQLTELGLLGPDPTEREMVEALYRFLTWTPARLLGVALSDATGDRRTMNQPGTDGTQYPNWKLPLADGEGVPVLLEDIMTSVRAASLARAVDNR
jgi:4-alpha-glucanotransferase